MPNIPINPYDLFDERILNFQMKSSEYAGSYVNLDNAATTPPFKVVENAVQDYLRSYGSVHRGAGIKSKISTDIYEQSRDNIKKSVNSGSDDYVLFSNNTTGAVNMAAHFFAFLEGKIAVSAIEHSSSWLPWVVAEGEKAIGSQRYGINEFDAVNHQIQALGQKQVLRYDVDDNFQFDFHSIESLLTKDKVKALVLTASSNLNGYCPDIKAIGEIAHRHGAWFIVDACQFIQHHPVDMQAMGIDFLVASGHKFYAPYGGGFLIGPKDFFDKFLPYQIGGGNLPYITEEGEFIRYQNQLAHDPGTPNSVGAIAMSVALDELNRIGFENIEKYEKGLAAKLYDYMKTNSKVDLYVSENHLNTILPFNIKGMSAVSVSECLNQEFGIGVRAGSFCVYHALKKLLMIKDERQIIKEVIDGNTENVPAVVRASIGLCNTESDIDRMIQAIRKLTNKL